MRDSSSHVELTQLTISQAFTGCFDHETRWKLLEGFLKVVGGQSEALGKLGFTYPV